MPTQEIIDALAIALRRNDTEMTALALAILEMRMPPEELLALLENLLEEDPALPPAIPVLAA